MALLGEKGWEIWSAGSPAPRLLPAEANLAQEKIDALALPSRNLLATSHWLIKADASTLRNTMLLELERQGLVNSRQPVDSMDLQILSEEGARCLVAGCMLTTPPTALPKTKAFVSTSDLLPLPQDSLVLWKEGADFVLAATRGNRCIYFEVLPTDSPESSLPSKFLITQLELEEEGISSYFKNITIWCSLTHATLTDIATITGLPISPATRPTPRLGSNYWHIVPKVVAEQKAETNRQSIFIKCFLVAVFFYLIVAGIYVKQYYDLQAERDALKVKLVSTGKQALEFQKTSARWEALRPAFDPSQFLLEKLLAIKSAVTDENTHLISLEITPVKVTASHTLKVDISAIPLPTKITIRGEASSARLAYTFFENLKGNPTLSGYSWIMPEPKILPNNYAQFQVEGSPGGTSK